MKYPNKDNTIKIGNSEVYNFCSPFLHSNKHRELKYCRDHNLKPKQIKVTAVTFERLENLKGCVDGGMWYTNVSLNDVIRCLFK